jgi:hypothetical protein
MLDGDTGWYLRNLKKVYALSVDVADGEKDWFDYKIEP